MQSDISQLVITISILSCKNSLIFAFPAYSIAWWPELSFSVGSAPRKKMFAVIYYLQKANQQISIHVAMT